MTTNPNTFSNFSQSWQRATHFREFDLQSEASIPYTDVEEPKRDWGTIHSGYLQNPLLYKLGFESSQLSYGTITRDPGNTLPASTQLANIMAKSEYGTLNDIGGSTLPMTIFNCTNMLVGVGTLSLALGLQQCGWIVGIILLTLPALVTKYTAKLLVKCLDADSSAFTYGDIASLAYGSSGRHFIEVLFASELLAANAALFILFADSFSALAPSLASSTCKIIIAICMIPLNFTPFKALSIISAIGIFCFIGILTTLVVAGLTKGEAPGSLLELAPTSTIPYDWRALPASIGIFMAPWGGHSIVPAVYKDMRHPQKYNKALKYTYSICYGIALTLAVLGYIMFGDTILPEVTSSILSISEYPAALSAITLVLVTTIPLTKISLNNRPVLDILERKCGRHSQETDLKPCQSGNNQQLCWLTRFGVGASCNLLELILALAIPNFSNVVALMGSAFCVTISVTLPGCFYLRICRDMGLTVSTFDRFACWTLIVVGNVCAVAGALSTILKDIH